MTDETKPSNADPADNAEASSPTVEGTPGPAKPGAPVAAKPAAPPAAAGAAKPAAPAAARPAPAPRPAPAGPSAAAIAGKTTTAAAASARTAAKKEDVEDDTSPLLSRRQWIGLAWGGFTAASAAALAATGRFMFPNVLNEPPQQFRIGFPNEYVMGVDERWKDKFGIWVVRTSEDIVQGAAGFYALISVCTHLGCTPNWLSAENKFKCPCHGSGFRPTGINFEGPAPRPLERARIVLAEDGQILVDKARKFQFELAQWTDPEAFLKA
jgi:cytochrome b6-f complex iron-sulfur subunit